MTTSTTKRSTSKTIRNDYILKQLEQLIQARFRDVEVMVKHYLNGNASYFRGDITNYLSIYEPDSFLNEGESNLLKSISEFSKEQAGILIKNIAVEQGKFIASYNSSKVRNSSGYNPYLYDRCPPGYNDTPFGTGAMGEQFQGIYPQQRPSGNQTTYTDAHTGYVQGSRQCDTSRTNNGFKIDPTMQQGVEFKSKYEVLYNALNLPADEKQVLKHMVDYVNANSNSTDGKVKRLVEAYKKSIDAICDMR